VRELRLLRPYLARYRWTYVLGALAIVAAVFLRVLVPTILGDSIDVLRRGGEAELDAGEVAGLIGRGALLVVLVAGVGALVRTASRLLILGGSRRVVHDLRADVFDALLRLSPSFYVRNKTGEIMSRAVNDVRNVQGLMGPVYMYLAETAVMYVICASMMIAVSPRLFLLGVLPFPLFVWAARRLAGRIQRGSKAAQEKLADVSSKVDESLQGHMVIQTMTLEEFDFERFERRCGEYRDLNLEVTWDRGTLSSLMMGLAALSTILVLLVGGPMVVRGDISLGEFVATVFYLQMMAAPTGVLGFVISSLQRGAAALSRVRELVESEVTLFDPPAPLEVGPALGELSVRDLTVRYAPPELPEVDRVELDEPAPSATRGNGAAVAEGEVPDESRMRTALEGVSFDLPAGGTLGVVGHTGAGKTTLLRVLARQLEVERGHVSFGGRDVNDLRLADVRERVGFVPQETFLFSKTLAENVALGRPDATREEVARAVDDARLGKDLDQLPDGLDTMLGERGVNLSGGQRQRTALARVMLLEPDLLLLDDTLSAVDSSTAEEILERLEPMMAGRSTVIVAHRLSTVRHADRILVLQEGRVVEEGTHEELLARGGAYARVWRQQAERGDGNGASNGTSNGGRLS
jgi:ATP-binding cassette subfamily B protein